MIKMVKVFCLVEGKVLGQAARMIRPQRSLPLVTEICELRLGPEERAIRIGLAPCFETNG